MPEPFRLGVNYWPAETAMAWLPRFDRHVVARDFDQIAATGMDTVRIFLRWEDLQPEPDVIARGALEAVVETADIAHDTGVSLVITLFTGHMSGVNWIPAWATGGSDGDRRFRVVASGVVRPRSDDLRNWYGDPLVVDAQVKQAATVATALTGHPAVWAWDLGNESSNCTVPTTASDAAMWLERVTSALRANDPGRPITVGTHMEDLESDRRIGPAEAARWCDFVCMHGYPGYADWSAGPTDEHLVPFLAEVTAWLAGDVPVLFEELGHPTAPPGRPPVGLQVSEEEAARYAGHTVDALHRAGAIGALLWCFADYDPALFGTPPLDLAEHERTFGLWRADHTPKPVVDEMRSRRGRRCLPGPAGRPWLDITPEELGLDRRGQLPRLFRAYRAYHASLGS